MVDSYDEILQYGGQLPASMNLSESGMHIIFVL